ncbi:PepSY-associated TM helix domain-containing protein [Undibacterium terreum]|uniref:Membrane protein n=1 Tax=Undibacterium terreum TaxID=1224302 RepID=A0A916V046_9BURK|nr:PepSY-associated TM helix domain-containing protein [Undibacterium terreum]GGC97420.1 membrane protein [Undibacterium terreum]
MSEIAITKQSNQQRRSFWLKHLHQWHWISSALCIIAMLLFAATGITLNHSAQIEAHPQVTKKTAQVPEALVSQLASLQQAQKHGAKDPLPLPVRDWLGKQLSISVGEQAAEWSKEEVYVSLPRPGGDAWLRVDLESGDLEYELTDRGWVSYFNDLHKGRNTGAAWPWFIDIFAGACLVFCITGLFLLQLHSGNRPTTWPIVGFGLLVPLLLAIVLIH